jgi:ribonuclease BN (tRNA processing enzyme)
MPVFVPPGQAASLRRLGEAFAFRGALEPPGPLVEAAGAHRVRDVEIRFAPTRHSAPSIATRIGGLVYASDTAPCDELAALADGCDLLLTHALLPRVAAGSAHAKRHMTAEDAARLAKATRARRLLLSHRYHESNDADMLAAAPGAVLARTGAVYDVTGT